MYEVRSDRNTNNGSRQSFLTLSRSLTNTVSLAFSLVSITSLYSYRRHPSSGFLRISFASLISLVLSLREMSAIQLRRVGFFWKIVPCFSLDKSYLVRFLVVVFCAAVSRAHCICVYSLTFLFFNLFDEVYGSQYMYVCWGGSFLLPSEAEILGHK